MSLGIVELTDYFPVASTVRTAELRARRRTPMPQRPTDTALVVGQHRRLPVAVLHPLLLGRRALRVPIRQVGHVDVLGVDLGHHELAKLGELLDLLAGEYVAALEACVRPSALSLSAVNVWMRRCS